MKKWDNPEVVELKIRETYKSQTEDDIADEWDIAKREFKQGFDESGPTMTVDEYLKLIG